MTLVKERFSKALASAFPLNFSPLIQCITNEITCETMANALLYVDAKPCMADDPREFVEFFAVNGGVLLNLGHISPARVANLIDAARIAKQTNTPSVVDLVGVTATKIRYDLGHTLLAESPNIVKGNISEMRTFCQLPSFGSGVDGSTLDQTPEALQQLIDSLKGLVSKHPHTVFVATGIKDVVISRYGAYVLENGVEQLDRFTGTGDIVGALMVALLAVGLSAEEAAVVAISYFNLCGETAVSMLGNESIGLASFRMETLNQLSLLMNDSNWFAAVKGLVV